MLELLYCCSEYFVSRVGISEDKRISKIGREAFIILYQWIIGHPVRLIFFPEHPFFKILELWFCKSGIFQSSHSFNSEIREKNGKSSQSLIRQHLSWHKSFELNWKKSKFCHFRWNITISHNAFLKHHKLQLRHCPILDEIITNHSSSILAMFIVWECFDKCKK